MSVAAPPPSAPPSGRELRRSDPRGDQRFWEVFDVVVATAKRERREFFTFAEWDWIVRTVELDASEGRGFPTFLAPALARRRRKIEEYRALGWSAEDLYRDECLQERRDAERRAQAESDERNRRAVQKLGTRRSRARIGSAD